MLSKTPVLLSTVMLIEAAILIAGFKMLGGGPQAAAGAEFTTPDDSRAGGRSDGKSPTRKKTAELLVLDFKAPNKVNGRTFLYDVSIYVVVKAKDEQLVKDTLKEREALIKDRVRTIIAQSDPEKLVGGSEPGLETLRRQVKYQLDTIIGEGMIDEVLVPKCIPFRTDY
jgi:flagellar basal body-associated protein FliL